MVTRLVARWVWDWRRELALGLGVLLAVGMFGGTTGGRVLLVVAAGLVLGVRRLRSGLAGWLVGGRWRRRWAGACRACRLAVAWERTPRVRRVRATPAGVELAVQVRPGQAITDLVSGSDALAAALGVRSLAVSADPLHAGRGTVLLRMHDPLAAAVDPIPLPTPEAAAVPVALRSAGWPAVDGPAAGGPGAVLAVREPVPVAGRGLVPVAVGIAELAGLGGLVIGRREDGGPWQLPLLGSHVLVAGATGAGKGSVLWSIVRALAPAVRAGLVEIWACDPKGGMELAAGGPLFARFAWDLDSIADLLDEASQAMTDRAGRLRGVTRAHTPVPGDPLIVVLVDELADLTAYTDGDLRKRMAGSLQRLLSQGRAVGFSVVGAVQDPRKETLPFRDLFPVRVALRLAEASVVDLVLRRGAWDAGAHCEQIPLALAGVGYVRTDTEPRPVMVRAGWQDDDDIRTVARVFGVHGPAATSESAVVSEVAPGPVAGWVPDLDAYGSGSGPAAAPGAGAEEPPTVPLRGWSPPPPAALPPAGGELPGSAPGGSGRIDENDVAAWERWAAGWRRRNGLDDGGA
ncbi:MULTISPECIES: FtsK/SpoIIIE domain-containing protein [unclassified Frankia]|uniref:FtsK/SpoIIIE domain-containing protein n=1 Tax=unclassified Frankia TaxID=2632575 RepID=UPI001EE44B92|nr:MULTISPECIES: FtsK/SpoIIIE domain-containing protein [unclassified Frankia]